MTNMYEGSFIKVENLTNHSKSNLHREALLKLKLTASQPPINAVPRQQAKDQQDFNNRQLVIIIQALQYLRRQNHAAYQDTCKDGKRHDSSI